MPLRALVAGSLRESGPWDAYARTAGEHLARAGVALAVAESSTFGRTLAEGWARAPPGEAPAPETVPDGATRDALRRADVLLVAGNGGGLADLLRDAARRGVPAVPLPIPQTTSEDLWERHAGAAFARVSVSTELRTAFLGLRRTDPRSAKSAEALAGLVAGLAGAPDLAGGARVLLLAPVTARAPDGLDLVARRALRAHAPGARLERAPDGWLRSPGRALADAVRAADLVLVALDGGPGTAFALGLARGGKRAAVALARRGEPRGIDPGAVDAVVWETEAELAGKLDRALAKLRPTARAPAKGGAPKRKRRRGRGPKARGAGEGAAPAEARPPPDG